MELDESVHPNDIVLRELALFEFLKGNGSRAKKLIVRSKKAMQLGGSDIPRFLENVNVVHEDHIYGRRLSRDRYFLGIRQNELVKKIIEEGDDLVFFKNSALFLTILDVTIRIWSCVITQA